MREASNYLEDGLIHHRAVDPLDWDMEVGAGRVTQDDISILSDIAQHLLPGHAFWSVVAAPGAAYLAC